MPSFDQSNFRAFRLHTIVQNVGTELYLKYLKKKAEESFPSLKALLDNPTEKAKLLQAFKKDPVYSPYDDSGNLKPVYPESMDIIKLNKLHKYCEVLRKDSVASQFDHWWNSKNGELVFDAVSKSKRCLLGQPGTACLVLYHVRNRLLPGPQKNEFSLDEKAYSMALDVAIPALEVLAVHLGMEDSVEFRISKAKRDTIDENACSDVFTHYKLDMSSMRSDADIIKAVFKRTDLHQLWADELDIDGILSNLIIHDFISHRNDLPTIKSHPAKTDQLVALWNMLMIKLEKRDRFKLLCNLIRELKQSRIADALMNAWLEESGGIDL